MASFDEQASWADSLYDDIGTTEENFEDSDVVTLDLPASLGDEALGFMVKISTASIVQDVYIIILTQGQIRGQFTVWGPADRVALKDVLP